MKKLMKPQSLAMNRLVPLSILLLLGGGAGWALMNFADPRGSEKEPAAEVSVPPTRTGDAAVARVRGAKDRWTAIHAAIELARSIPAGERRTWLQDGRFRHPDPLVTQMFTLQLEELLFQDDPFALIEWEMATGRDAAQKHLARIAREDVEALIARGQGSADVQKGRAMLFTAMKVLVEREPERVLKMALEFPPPADGNELPKSMVHLLAKASGGNASKLLDLSETKGDRWRALLRAAAARAMVEKDVASGLKWIIAEPDGGRLFTEAFLFHGVYSEEMMSVAELDANKRWVAEHLNQLPDGFIREINRGRRLGSWPSMSDFAGVEKFWLAADLGRLGISTREQEDFRVDLMMMMANNDPAAVAKHLDDPAMFSVTQRKLAIQRISQMQIGWHGKLPDEIMAVLKEDEMKVVEAMVANNKKDQTTVKKPLSIPEQFTTLMNEPGSESLHLRAENWAPEQEDQALAYVRNADPKLLAELTKRILRTGYPFKPVAAEIYRRALENNIVSPRLREEIIETSIHWADADPIRAAAWVETLPGGVERLRSIQNVAAQWTRDDPAGAQAWIATLKDKAEAEAAREAVRIFDAKSKTRLEE